jgi:hypothetical protein
MFALCRRIGYSEASSEIIEDIYDAVKKTNNASYMRHPETPKINGGGFLFCEDPELGEIKQELKIRDGSETALVFGLRNVQHILKDYEDFVVINYTYFGNKMYGCSDTTTNTTNKTSNEITPNEKTLRDLKEDFKVQLIKDLMMTK